VFIGGGEPKLAVMVVVVVILKTYKKYILYERKAGRGKYINYWVEGEVAYFSKKAKASKERDNSVQALLLVLFVCYWGGLGLPCVHSEL
jgi:hypothetical protein